MHELFALFGCVILSVVSGVMLFASGPGPRPGWINGVFLVAVAASVLLILRIALRHLHRRAYRELDDLERRSR